MGFDLFLGLDYSDVMEGPLRVNQKLKLDSMTNFEPSLSLGLCGDQSYQGGVDLYCHGSPRSDIVSSFSNPRERVVCSEEDENGVNGRKKLRLTKQQSALLEESFKQHSTLNPKQKQVLARQINLRPRQVEVWFQNRRARTKLKQTEIDCNILKKYCEKLTEENRRLQKELHELKALKLGHPYYMHMPAATLTMCPSCERIGGGGGGGGNGLRF